MALMNILNKHGPRIGKLHPCWSVSYFSLNMFRLSFL